MPLDTVDLARWNRVSIGLGAFAWMLITSISILGWVGLHALDLILLLALWVITPLAIPLAAYPQESERLRSLQRMIIFWQPLAAIVGGISFLLSTGLGAGAAAGGWFFFTMLIAMLGVGRLRQVGATSLANTCLAVALIYLPIGSAWLVVSRLGLRPLDFTPDTVLLTAVHFHFITLAALIMTGLIGQSVWATGTTLRRQLYRVAAIGLLVEPLLVAAGITFAQVTGEVFLESAAATLLALSLILETLLSLRFIVPATVSRLAQGLLLVSGTAVFFTMLVAGAYALGTATGAWTITVSQMIVVHGWINALAFGLCGLLGWRLKMRRKET